MPSGSRLVPDSRIQSPYRPRLDLIGTMLASAGPALYRHRSRHQRLDLLGHPAARRRQRGPARHLRPLPTAQRPPDARPDVVPQRPLHRCRSGPHGHVLPPGRLDLRDDPDLPVRPRLLPAAGRNPVTAQRPGPDRRSRDRYQGRLQVRHPRHRHRRAADRGRGPGLQRHCPRRIRLPALRHRRVAHVRGDRPDHGTRHRIDHVLAAARQDRHRLRGQQHHPQPQHRPRCSCGREHHRHQLHPRHERPARLTVHRHSRHRPRPPRTHRHPHSPHPRRRRLRPRRELGHRDHRSGRPDRRDPHQPGRSAAPRRLSPGQPASFSVHVP